MTLDSMGDGAWRLQLPTGADPASALACLRALPDVLDAVVADGFALVRFAPGRPPADPLPLLQNLPTLPIAGRQTHIVRVRYDGPDLAEVATRAGISVSDVIALHAGRDYLVEVVGFLPGFAYLGPVAPELVVPRRPSPRLRVSAGSVGLAAGRTAIYPFDSPGGWNLIGTAQDFQPFAFRLGDRVRFEAVQ